MICYAFPLEHESADFLKRCTQKESFAIGRLKCTLANFGDRPILVALVGMGQEQARENTETIFQYFRPKAMVLSGYAGALLPTLKVGQVLVSNNYTTAQVLPFLRVVPGFDFATFTTTDEIISTPETRERQARKSKGQVVEMETAAVADVVMAREIPFLAIRVISDEYEQTLPVGALAAGFDPVKGRPTPLKLLSYLAAHPKEMVPFKNFVVGLNPARKKLADFLQQLNEELPRKW